MSLFGSLLPDMEEDPFFGTHMRQMRQMSTMMNSIMAGDPFGMFGGMGLGGMPRHSTSLMPFMPQMPAINRLFAEPAAPAELEEAATWLGGNVSTHVAAHNRARPRDQGELENHMGVGAGHGASFSSRTLVMSSGPNGKPEVYSSSSSTQIGPGGVKETRKTLEDSRTGTKKMSIGHHIGERGHVVEREQNLYSGDREEHEEFINLEEEEAEDFSREFREKSGPYSARGQELMLPAAVPARLALPAAPSAAAAPNYERYSSSGRLKARRPLRVSTSPQTSSSAGVRSVYSGSHPQRHRHKARASRHNPQDE